ETPPPESRAPLLEGRDLATDLDDLAGGDHADDRFARRAKSESDSHQQPVAAAELQTPDYGVARGHGRGRQPHADVFVPRTRLRHLPDLELSRRPVPREDRRLHGRDASP